MRESARDSIYTINGASVYLLSFCIRSGYGHIGSVALYASVFESLCAHVCDSVCVGLAGLGGGGGGGGEERKLLSTGRQDLCVDGCYGERDFIGSRVITLTFFYVFVCLYIT